MSIDISRNKRLRSDRTLICGAAAAMHARDRPSHYGHRGAFFCSAGACPPQSLPHPVHPDNPGHPASDVIDIKVLTDLFSWLRLCSIDIKVFQTFFSFILLILLILAILLQTAERVRGTGPRPTGGSPAPIGQEHPILPIRERVLPNLREARLEDGYPIL